MGKVPAPAIAGFNCPACGGYSPDKLLGRECTFRNQEFHLSACQGCNAWVWLPLQADTSFYEEAELPNYERRHRGEVFLRRRHELCLDQLRGMAPTTVLDVGCGEGGFLEKVQELGHGVVGVDIDAKSVEIARQRLGDSCVHLGSAEALFDQGVLRERSFGAATMCEVIEHVTSASAGLRAAACLLKPGGVLLGSVPNRHRLAADWMRQIDDADFPPHHYVWFDDVSMTRALERTGWIDISVAKFHQESRQKSAAYAMAIVRAGVRVKLDRPHERRPSGAHALRPGAESSRRQALCRARDILGLPLGLAFRTLGQPSGLFLRAVRPSRSSV